MRNFYYAANVQYPLYQFIGTFTSIDNLLKYQGEDFKKLRKRIQILLNDEIYNKEKIEEFLKKRNNFIHEIASANIEDVFVSFQIFTYVILRYSFLAIKFGDRIKIKNIKDSLIHHLDLVFSIKSGSLINNIFDMLPIWEEIEKQYPVIDFTVVHTFEFFDIKNQKDSKINIAQIIYFYNYKKKAEL